MSLNNLRESPIPLVSEEASILGQTVVNMITSVRMLASLPNQKYIDAMDLNIIRDDIMSMDPSNCSETQAILDDDDIMSALERADRQYKEGRAKSLRNLAKDLGFEVDALLD